MLPAIHIRKPVGGLACALAVAAISAPTASAAPEYRSTDRVLAESAGSALAAPEYRSPDRVLAELGREIPVVSPGVTSDTAESGGFDWSTAAITAGALGALLVLSVGVLSGLGRRRRVVRS
jgi:hypothetical protein